MISHFSKSSLQQYWLLSVITKKQIHLVNLNKVIKKSLIIKENEAWPKSSVDVCSELGPICYWCYIAKPALILCTLEVLHKILFTQNLNSAFLHPSTAKSISQFHRKIPHLTNVTGLLRDNKKIISPRSSIISHLARHTSLLFTSICNLSQWDSQSYRKIPQNINFSPMTVLLRYNEKL